MGEANQMMKYCRYDLYNSDTEEVEATELHTSDEVRRRNDILRSNGEPQRWVPMPRLDD